MIEVQAVFDAVDELADQLIEVSHRIHAHPETCFEERFAHDTLCDVIESCGWDVSRHAYGLETAFVATKGDGPGPHVAVLCEYDALPEIGHACGHNVIGAAGLGAGLAAGRFVDQTQGRVSIVGTPAEEGGGGKIELIHANAFDGIDAALMVHAAGTDLDRMDVVALHELRVTMTGVPAHAAAFPHLGRNALDAVVLAYSNVAALRQHIASDERVHGIITKGGDQANIVPHECSMQWYVRSGSLERLRDLKERVLQCIEAGAIATGCTMTAEWIGREYAEMVHNDTLIGRYVHNAAKLGRTVQPLSSAKHRVIGSTDMGNVSRIVPSIHPMIGIGRVDAAIHTPEFEQLAGRAGGDAAVIDGAKILAATVIDIWQIPGLSTQIAAEFAAERPGPLSASELTS